MNRSKEVTLALALLAVVVVGIAAATISTSVSQPGRGGGTGSDGGGEGTEDEDDERVLPEVGFDFDFTLEPGRQNEDRSDEDPGDASGKRDGGSALSPGSPAGAAALVGVVVLVGLAFLLRARDEGGGEDATETADDSESVARVREAAGRAATRIESSPDAYPDNEVYRAWAEMTDHLDVASPHSSTPGEFAAAAVEAGMDREDVSELTAVFTEVRYGGRSATDERERRAVEALRRIERSTEQSSDKPEEGRPGDAPEEGRPDEPPEEGRPDEPPGTEGSP